MADTTGVTGALTDGTGVSALTNSKLLKDIVLDFCLSLPVALLAANIMSLESALAVPVAAAFAVGDTAVRVGFRAVLRWAQS